MTFAMDLGGDFAEVLPDLGARDLVTVFNDRADFPPDAAFFDAVFATAEPRSLRTELPNLRYRGHNSTPPEKIGKYNDRQRLRSSKR